MKNLVEIPAGIDDTDQFEQEVQQYQIDNRLLQFHQKDRIDVWYAENVFSKYPVLGQVIKASLTIFHGPQVESSFSMMNNIVDDKSMRMNVSTSHYRELNTG